MCAREISHKKEYFFVAFRNSVYLFELFSVIWFCFATKILADFHRLEVNFFCKSSAMWLQVEESATNRCTWHFGSSRFVKLPIRNVVYFSDGVLRMKSRWWCQNLSYIHVRMFWIPTCFAGICLTFPLFYFCKKIFF